MRAPLAGTGRFDTILSLGPDERSGPHPYDAGRHRGDRDRLGNVATDLGVGMLRTGKGINQAMKRLVWVDDSTEGPELSQVLSSESFGPHAAREVFDRPRPPE